MDSEMEEEEESEECAEKCELTGFKSVHLMIMKATDKTKLNITKEELSLVADKN
jgi:hypothetical protein